MTDPGGVLGRYPRRTRCGVPVTPALALAHGALGSLPPTKAEPRWGRCPCALGAQLVSAGCQATGWKFKAKSGACGRPRRLPLCPPGRGATRRGGAHNARSGAAERISGGFCGAQTGCRLAGKPPTPALLGTPGLVHWSCPGLSAPWTRESGSRVTSELVSAPPPGKGRRPPAPLQEIPERDPPRPARAACLPGEARRGQQSFLEGQLGLGPQSLL